MFVFGYVFASTEIHFVFAKYQNPQVLPIRASEIRDLKKRMAASSQALHAGCKLKSFLSEGLVWLNGLRKMIQNL